MFGAKAKILLDAHVPLGPAASPSSSPPSSFLLLHTLFLYLGSCHPRGTPRLNCPAPGFILIQPPAVAAIRGVSQWMEALTLSLSLSSIRKDPMSAMRKVIGNNRSGGRWVRDCAMAKGRGFEGVWAEVLRR